MLSRQWGKLLVDSDVLFLDSRKGAKFLALPVLAVSSLIVFIGRENRRRRNSRRKLSERLGSMNVFDCTVWESGECSEKWCPDMTTWFSVEYFMYLDECSYFRESSIHIIEVYTRFPIVSENRQATPPRSEISELILWKCTYIIIMIFLTYRCHNTNK